MKTNTSANQTRPTNNNTSQSGCGCQNGQRCTCQTCACKACACGSRCGK